MKNKFIIILFIIFLLVIMVVVYNRWKVAEQGTEYLEATGIIEVTEVEVSPKIPEKIVWLCCGEGDVVRKGDVLIRLDDSEIKAKVREATAAVKSEEAGYKVAEANLENARARVESASAELAAAGSEVDRARALFREARDNMKRLSGLFTEGYAAKKELDAAEAGFDTTGAQLNAAVAKKAAMEAVLATARAGFKAAEAQLVSAKAGIEEAEARLQLTKTQAADRVIVSPTDGVIAYKSHEEGEVAYTGGTIYTIHDMEKVWARVDIEETDIGRIRQGEKGIILSIAAPDRRFEGRIIEIGREARFATQRDVTRGRQDIKTFRVKVELISPEGILKPGMTVVVGFP